MNRVYSTVLACACLAGCVARPEPPSLEQQVAIWKWQEAVLEAAQDADSRRRDEELARERPARDTAEQQEAAQFGAAVSAQQKALATLRPHMLSCLASQIHALAPASTRPASVVADAVIQECRPAIDAVARTVELARFSSDGLAADMKARLRPGIIRAVIADRAQARGAARRG